MLRHKMIPIIFLLACLTMVCAHAEDASEWDLSTGDCVISSGGTYRVWQSSGSTEHTISVDTTDAVTLILDGVDISSSDISPISTTGGDLELQLIGENRLAVEGPSDKPVYGIYIPEDQASALSVVPAETGASLQIDVLSNRGSAGGPDCAGIFCRDFCNSADLSITVTGSASSSSALSGICCNGGDFTSFYNEGTLSIMVHSDPTRYAFTYAAGVAGQFASFMNEGTLRVTAWNANKDAYGLSCTIQDGGSFSNRGRIDMDVTALGGTGAEYMGSDGFSNNATGIDLGCDGAVTLENTGDMHIVTTNHGDGENNHLEYASAISLVGGDEPAFIINDGTMDLSATCGYSYGIYAENFNAPAIVQNNGVMDIYVTTRGQYNGNKQEPHDDWDLATGIGILLAFPNYDQPLLILGDGSTLNITAEPEAGCTVDPSHVRAVVAKQYYSDDLITAAPMQIELADTLSVRRGGALLQEFPTEPDDFDYYYLTTFSEDGERYAPSLQVKAPYTSITLMLDGHPYTKQQVALDAAPDAGSPALAIPEAKGLYRALVQPGTYYIYVNGDCVNPDAPLAVPQAGADAAIQYYTVSFDLNGAEGTAPGKQVVLSGRPAAMPPAPSRSGYRFLGWKTAASGGNDFAFDRGVTGTSTAYAAWEKEGGAPPSDSQTGGSSGGGSGGGTSGSVQTETTKNPDGSTTTVTTDQKTGAITETTKTPDGTTKKVETSTDGTKTVTEERKDGTKVKSVVTPDSTTVSVSVPQGTVSAKVTLPADNITPGTVAVLIKEDGTREIIKGCLPAADGVAVTLSGNATLEVIDNSKSFVDVEQDAWYAPAVQFTAAREILQGTDQDTFTPALPTTRSMVVTMLHRLAGEPDATGVQFADVAAQDWYAGAVAWATERGVVTGVNEKEFAPEQPVSRQELAVMLYRYGNLNQTDGGITAPADLSGFLDATQVDAYARPAIEWAISHKILNGQPDGSLSPHAPASRAEVATMLMRFMENTDG